MFRVPLGALRDLANQFLPDVAVIQRATVVETGDGRTTTWATSSTVACRIQRLGRGAGSEAVGATGGVVSVAQLQIVMPAGTDVTPKDRLQVAGRAFEVKAVPPKSYDAICIALCDEIL